MQSTSGEVVPSKREADTASTGGVVKPRGLVPLSTGGKVKPSGAVAQNEALSNAKVVKPRKLAKEMDTKKINAKTKKTDTRNSDERTKKIDEKTNKKESKTAKGSKAAKGPETRVKKQRLQASLRMGKIYIFIIFKKQLL